MGGPGPGGQPMGYRGGMPPTSQSMMQQGKGMYKVILSNCVYGTRSHVVIPRENEGI